MRIGIINIRVLKYGRLVFPWIKTNLPISLSLVDLMKACTSAIFQTWTNIAMAVLASFNFWIDRDG